MSYAIFKPKRGTAAQWSAVDPILKLGEMGIQVCDEGVGKGVCRIKFGDGVSKWSELPFGICPEAYATGENISYDQFVKKDEMSYTDTQLDQMSIDVASNKAKVNTNTTNITQLQTDTNSINGRITSITNDVNSLDTRVVTAQATADGALSSANNAYESATNATTKAESALSSATTAYNTAVSWESNAATLSTTYTGGGSVRYYRGARAVQVNINDLKIKASAVNAGAKAYTIASGLPKPIGANPYSHIFIQGGQSNKAGVKVDTNGNLVMYVYDNTAIPTQINTDGTYHLAGTLCYICTTG